MGESHLSKRLLVSPISGRIYLAKVKALKEDPSCYVADGKKEDYTEECLNATMNYFLCRVKEKGHENGVSLRVDDKQGQAWRLTFTRVIPDE